MVQIYAENMSYHLFVCWVCHVNHRAGKPLVPASCW